jgi:hypothetical protein
VDPDTVTSLHRAEFCDEQLSRVLFVPKTIFSDPTITMANIPADSVLQSRACKCFLIEIFTSLLGLSKTIIDLDFKISITGQLNDSLGLQI